MAAPWPGKGMITVAEFGAYAQLTPKVVCKMIEDEKLYALKLGKEWRIPRGEAFRVLGLADPEGPPQPVMQPARRPLNARSEALLQRLRVD